MSESEARARRALESLSQGSQPYRTVNQRVGTRASSTASQPKPQDKWCPNCQIWNRPDADNCVSCGGALEAESQRTNPANHGLVWICAFVPLAGLVADFILVSAGIISWWTFIPVIASNWILLGIDETRLTKQGYNTNRLKGLTTILVPVYLFKRVAVAGGGYGYGSVWVATFLASLLIPFMFTSGPSFDNRTFGNTFLHTDVAYSDGKEISLIIQFRDDAGNSVRVGGEATISVVDESGIQQRRFTQEVDKSLYQQYQNSLTFQTFSAVELSVPYSIDDRTLTWGPLPSVRLRFETDDGYWEDVEIPVLPES